MADYHSASDKPTLLLKDALTSPSDVLLQDLLASRIVIADFNVVLWPSWLRRSSNNRKIRGSSPRGTFSYLLTWHFDSY